MHRDQIPTTYDAARAENRFFRGETKRGAEWLRRKRSNRLAVLTPEPDARVENHGTIFLVRPLTDAIREHLEENVSEEAQWFGGALAVEHRFVPDLVAGLRDAGFVVEAK